MIFGSLFTGIGGIDLGLERAGMQCAWQVEINEYAQEVLQKHWSNVTRFRDVRECGKHNLTQVDLIAGGFPCQDISDCGKQAGIDGERSGLWKEFYRIICELQPRYILVENVSALTHRGLGRVLGDLAASRYNAEWQVLPASAFGAPHRRDRLFIVAYPDSLHLEKPILANMPRRPSFQPLRVHAVSVSSSQWTTDQPGLVGVVHGVSNWVEQSKGLGNAVVPVVAEFIGNCIQAANAITQTNVA